MSDGFYVLKTQPAGTARVLAEVALFRLLTIRKFSMQNIGSSFHTQAACG
jgi:hypothetical protein